MPLTILIVFVVSWPFWYAVVFHGNFDHFFLAMAPLWRGIGDEASFFVFFFLVVSTIVITPLVYLGLWLRRRHGH